MSKIMRTLFFIPLVLMSLVSFPSWGLTIDDLVEREGIYYKKFSNVPFNGEIEGKSQGEFQNGKRDGSWINYHDNGQLRSKGDYKNGNRDGPWVFYWETGGLMFEGGYKDTKGLYWNKEGLWIAYHPGGHLWYKGSYKNDKREGVWIGYSQYGEKDPLYTGTFKNGVRVSGEKFKAEDFFK